MPTRPPLAAATLAWTALALGLAGCGEMPSNTLNVAVVEPVGDFRPAPANPIKPQPPSRFRFTDIAPVSGVDFVHLSGKTDERHFPTSNGSGVAIFDYDGDGRMDLYFATNCRLPLGTADAPPNRLYRNLGDGRFEDATERSGLGFRGFTHGVVVGDVDNDGDPDVFLCTYMQNRLFENRGDGTFADITAAAGLDRPLWSSGGTFLDYDGDGDLDLYLANYGLWSLPEDDRFCTDEMFRYAPGEEKVRIYCSPLSVRTTPHTLLRNNGDRTFTDVTEAAGLARGDGRGFGALAADVDDDGRVDLYVANDMSINYLYLNRGDGTFDDASESSGAGLDRHGRAQSGMGLDAEDVDGDGRIDLFVTNFKDEYNTLYLNKGGGTFVDSSYETGLALDGMPYIGWGCGLVDLDLDGWPDGFVADGHLEDKWPQLGREIPYTQPALLYRNEGGKFRLATRDAGDYFVAAHVARGAAFGDLDDDGDLDIVVSHQDAPPAILRNDTPRDGNHWLRLSLVGDRSNRDAIGARVEVVAGGRTIRRQRKGGASLMSSHDPRLLIGVGPAERIESVTVRWPSGAVSRREGLAVDQSYEIAEGEAPSP